MPKPATLKLVDFGMAVCVPTNESLSELCGSPHYIAPEMLLRNYSYGVDVWAIGVLTFLLLRGFYPFNGSDKSEIYSKIKSGEKIHSAYFSLQAAHFLNCLLNIDPLKRPSAADALEDDWLQISDEVKTCETSAE